ncbi:hypothetical protein Sdiek2_0337 [Sulfurospirillum diekertiae]|nr:hypothetical protein Sdiek2_0337 [Sulfurospirillum diekertiae]
MWIFYWVDIFGAKFFRTRRDTLLYIRNNVSFYLIIHVAVMNFFDFDRLSTFIFNKKDHESIGDYFIQELENREKVMDSLLASIDNMNQHYDKIMKGSMESNESYSKKAA